MLTRTATKIPRPGPGWIADTLMPSTHRMVHGNDSTCPELIAGGGLASKYDVSHTNHEPVGEVEATI